MTEDENCNICGQSKRSDKPGTITQWMSICQCDLIEEKVEETLQICSICGKRIKEQNLGSLTQWVFQEEYCECESPQPYTDQSKTTPMKVSVAVDKEPDSSQYIELDPQSFPTERYKPIKKLGAGGKGIVYLCWDEHLKKRVAVKVLLNTTEDELVSFQREAKLTAKFKHENIIEILDFGVTENHNPFMVLKYINGIGLEVLLRRNGPAEISLALTLFIQMVDALHHGHQMGIYHRDMKTANVLLTGLEQGNPRALIIDFGVSATIGNQDATSVQGQTLVGTPRYMPPDQAMGNVYDARSEIYSFGCLMYELLSGKTPFDGEDVLALLSKHANEPVPPFEDSVSEEHLPPEELQKIIFKCLEKEPEKRFQSMIELKEALLSVQNKLNRPTSRSFSLIDIPVPEMEEAPYVKLLTPLNVGLVMLGISALVAFLVLIPRNQEETKNVVLNEVDVKKELPFEAVDDVIPEKMYKIAPCRWGNEFRPKFNLAFSDEHLKQIEQCPKVSAIALNGTDITGSGLAYALKFPIKYLDTRDSQLNNNGMAIVAKMTELNGLCVKRCGSLNDESLALIENLPLRFLNIDNNSGFTDQAMVSIAKLKELRQLNMENTRNINASGMAKLNTLPHLEALYISPEHKDPDYYKAIGNLKLKILGIQGDVGKERTKISKVCMEGLKNGFYYMKFYRVIMDKETLDTMRGFKNLKLVDFTGNKITNDQMEDVAKLKLKGISLINQEISDRGLLELTSMKSLKKLALMGNKFVSKKTVLNLKERRPDMQIIYNDPYAFSKDYSPYQTHPDWQ